MTATDYEDSARFRLLATFLARRSVDVAGAPAGTAAHTTGRTIFVTADRPAPEQRREMLVQAALLGAGSLDPHLVKPLRGRPRRARRYLALEARRVLTDLADTVPLATGLCLGADTATAEESLAVARGRAPVADPPEWFGVIRPALLLAAAARSPGPDTVPRLADLPGDDDGDVARVRPSATQSEHRFSIRATLMHFRKQFGGTRVTGNGLTGVGTVRAARRARLAGAHVTPSPLTRPYPIDGKPGAGGVLYPEWDVHRHRYRVDWCRVIDSTPAAEGDRAEAVVRDEVLRRRLARVRSGLEVRRGRPDGDDLDLDALVELVVDLRSGYSPPEHVYREYRPLGRDLGVLILVDASGSATDADPEGRTVHEHQRRAAATLAVTLEELGDRVAVYGFRSHGRHAVHLPAIKTFGQRFGAVERARLDLLRPSGYTRLGAGIRAAGDILKHHAGTRYRLLLVLSDGLAYEDGYEGRYAEADVGKALGELHGDGLGCLCLSLGSPTDVKAPERVFGTTGYAHATTLAELSPHMDRLFLSCLRETSAPRPPRSERDIDRRGGPQRWTRRHRGSEPTHAGLGYLPDHDVFSHRSSISEVDR